MVNMLLYMARKLLLAQSMQLFRYVYDDIVTVYQYTLVNTKIKNNKCFN